MENNKWLINHYKMRIDSFIALKKQTNKREEKDICDKKIQEAEEKIKELTKK